MFTVNGVIWNIKFVSRLNPNLLRSDGSFALGVCDDSTRTIYVADGLSDHKEDKVVCHELVHAFCFSYQLNLDLPTEELIADFLATYGREVFTVADDIIYRFYLVA